MFDDSHCLFSASTISVSHIANILGAITAVNSRVVISITAEGLNFITENSHVCRVELTLEKGLFSNFMFSNAKESRKRPTVADDDDGEVLTDTDDDNDAEVEEEGEVRFTVDIVPIVESLSLINKSQTSGTQCTMIYQGHGYPFVLIYEDSKITERCEFSTYVNLDFEAHNTTGFDLNQDEIMLEGMIKADVLYDAVKDLKDINTEDIYLYASTQNKRNRRLAIISKGEMGNSSLYLPNDRSILDQLHISDSSRVDISCYRFSLFSMALRAMKLSNKCKFKRDHNILSLNLLCLFGSDLPKNYTGTVFDFKLLQLIDREEQMTYFIKDNEEVHSKGPSSEIINPSGEQISILTTTPNDYVDHSNEDADEAVIDVPVFI